MHPPADRDEQDVSGKSTSQNWRMGAASAGQQSEDPPPGRLAHALAHLITERPRILFWAVGALLVVSALVIVFHVHFASDVLDMLPKKFDSVQIFKVFDRQFSQARELTFALYDEKKESDLDGFTEHFGEELRKEPWVVRVMDRTPIETPSGMKDVQTISVPLLLNLPSAEFDKALTALEPEAIGKRLAQLHSELEAGSPKAEFQLDFDPLNLVTPALKPLAGSFGAEQTRPLSSPDGTLHIVQAVTGQADLGVHACQATMRQVEDFKKRVLASWDGPKPEILVTGRTPYVAELSGKMRGDVISTFATSVVLVSLVFGLGYWRLRPLGAIMHVLLLCCIAAVGLGAFVFHELNMITIGLCSILIGLGVDFGMMLYSIYEAERDAGHDHASAIRAALSAQGRAVLFGSITSAAAFVCLIRSECPGFEQLGVLIAFGILFAGLFMMSVFFAFLGRKHKPRAWDPVRSLGITFANWAFANSKVIFCVTASILGLLTLCAALPVPPLNFDANPKSLEPKDSNAGRALRLITSKMPVGEPWIILVHAKNKEDLHERWDRLQASWSNLVTEKKLRSAATPAAFIMSPERVKANAAKLVSDRLAAARAALSDAIAREELKAESFSAAFAMLDTLAGITQGNVQALDWRTVLPEESSWHFVLDRFFGKDPMVTVGYITPPRQITSFDEKEALRKSLDVPGVEVHYSGWSYTLCDLVPWAKGKLLELSSIMISFNVALLVFLYRRRLIAESAVILAAWNAALLFLAHADAGKTSLASALAVMATAALLYFLYRRVYPLFVLLVSLALSVGAMLASLKIFGFSLNLFNVLAFPLVLGVGVDYGIYLTSAMRRHGDIRRATGLIVKPVLLSGLTAVAGFGSLGLAKNPALCSLGAVCAFGIAWCLFSTFFFILPLYAWRGTD